MYYFLQKKSYKFQKFICDLRELVKKMREIISHKRNYVINSS